MSDGLGKHKSYSSKPFNNKNMKIAQHIWNLKKKMKNSMENMNKSTSLKQHLKIIHVMPQK